MVNKVSTQPFHRQTCPARFLSAFKIKWRLSIEVLLVEPIKKTIFYFAKIKASAKIVGSDFSFGNIANALRDCSSYIKS
jgi:hypothetical protein